MHHTQQAPPIEDDDEYEDIDDDDDVTCSTARDTQQTWGSPAQDGAPTLCQVRGPLVLANPLHACHPLHLPPLPPSQQSTSTCATQAPVILAKRGRCSFADKARHAAAVGAVGVVVYNVAGEAGVVSMSGDDGMRMVIVVVCICMLFSGVLFTHQPLANHPRLHSRCTSDHGDACEWYNIVQHDARWAVGGSHTHAWQLDL